LTASLPSSATSNPNSQLAQIGKALQNGDVAGALQAAQPASSSGSSGISATQQQLQQQEQALAQALQSGNLGSAQSAFATLSANLPSGVTSNPNSQLAQIGQALQNGDVVGARNAAQSSSSSGSSSSSAAQQQQQQDEAALAQALQSNNLGAAQAAFTTLTANMPSSATSNPNSKLAQIGQALQNGDVAGARQAAQSTTGHHHHHHDGQQAASAVASSASSTSSTSGSASSGYTASTGTLINVTA
jgi:outer membrane protein assembly factor BamD (BamD/ComL family)